MTKIVNILLSLFAIVAIAFAVMGWWSARMAPAAVGVVNGHLAACAAEPHCVCSDAGSSDDNVHWVAAIALPAVPDEVRWRVVRAVLVGSGAHVVTDEAGYLHATYTSGLFRFVDDLELRMEAALLHVRSSSRVGYSDLGANRKRVEDLRLRLSAAFVNVKT